MSGNDIYKVEVYKGCFFRITQYKNNRKSTYVQAFWSGWCDQFYNETVESIISKTLEKIKLRILESEKTSQDEYSSTKHLKRLQIAIEQSKQLELF